MPKAISFTKKAALLAAKILVGTVAAVVLYAIVALVCSLIPANKNFSHTQGDITIYIASNGVHTDIILPVKNEYKDWSKHVKVEHTLAKDTLARYIGFGWGDRGFFVETPTWDKLKISTAFKAMFFLSTSAIHTTFYRYVYEDEDCVKLKVNAKIYAKLVEYVDRSFQKKSDGSYTPIAGCHHEYYDSFYEATGTYNLFFTCNTWTNSGLKYAKLKACLWTPVDKGILWQYRNLRLKQ